MKNLFREITSFCFRIIEKIHDKFFWHHQEHIEGQMYWTVLLKKLPYVRGSIAREIQTSFLHPHTLITTLKPFKKGFNSSSFTFFSLNTHKKQWILKIGHRISPVVDFGDPSSPSYAKLQEKHLRLLEKLISTFPRLQFLLPFPHLVQWIQHPFYSRKEGRTVILQPYLSILKPIEIRKLPPDTKNRLLLELEDFEKLCALLFEEHHLLPDLLGEDNVVVVRFEKDGYHLVLLDLGLMNMEFPLPLTKAAMHNAYLQSFKHYRTLLK
ncbi:hypothetical protein HGA88_06115 [Candidatus Roizmanbacteria bacterium]|nr:hypothetical protein [Candidatus Roizmanbacteria bacterium]